MNTILSIANGVLQYHRGRQTGLAGLLGIVIALGIVFQWHNILPVLEAIGLVGFLDKHGLIYEGEGYLTGYALFMIAFKASILLAVIIFVLLVVVIVCAMIFSNEIIFKIALTILTVITAPFFMIYFFFDHFRTPKAVREERKRLALESKRPVLEIVKESSELLTYDEAKNWLNRLPTLGDYHFLVAVTKEQEVFAILPRPRYWITHPAIKLKIDSNSKKNHSIDKSPLINVYYEHQGFNEKLETDFLASERTKIDISSDRIAYFLKPKSEEINAMFKWIAQSKAYKVYMNQEIDSYFKRKEKISRTISNSIEKEEFDKGVSAIKTMDASNEDIVKMMWDSKTYHVN
ncbi:hypothetical protein D1B31_18080 [Neobacillus notoginsengisoli]|uniref:Uncharacterized protein n=1 Tax=Neobacillus notoginsengisoli TaxID=1578198 RepID=A0A417YPS9_9BACI|nr:hypothetical protein [Neobacillus notoginsengisoli]RHW35997.1 hypothetical protein D1B31_18080 [Neobacillus notoginsengisoli]